MSRVAGIGPSERRGYHDERKPDSIDVDYGDGDDILITITGEGVSVRDVIGDEDGDVSIESAMSLAYETWLAALDAAYVIGAR